MSPDLRSQRQLGITALATAVLLVAGGLWWVVDDEAQASVRLSAAQEEIAKLKGKEPLRDRVKQQIKSNAELRANIARLKLATGFITASRFRVPPNSQEPGKFFSDTWTSVRQTLRQEAERRRIEPDEDLGFSKADRAPAVAELAQERLDILQITEKALNTAFGAPDPIESYEIKHERPDEGSMPLLKEYPLTLTVRGSLKTILWILHRFGSATDGETPLILRGLEISSENVKPRDDIQILSATFVLAAMAFPPESAAAPERLRAMPSGKPQGARP